jgi:hypothetical protein
LSVEQRMAVIRKDAKAGFYHLADGILFEAEK